MKCVYDNCDIWAIIALHLFTDILLYLLSGIIHVKFYIWSGLEQSNR